MASMGADDVRDVINVSAEDIPDAKVTKIIRCAEATSQLELNKDVTKTISLRLRYENHST